MTRGRGFVAVGLLAGVAITVALLATYTQAQPPGFGKGKFGFGKGPALKDKEGERKEDPRKEAPDRRKEGERKEGERKETPGKEGQRKDAERKESERKEGARPEGERLPPAERIRQLERELVQTQVRLQQLVQELIQAHMELMHEQWGRGPMPPLGPFNPPMPPLGPVNPPFGRPGFAGPGFPGAPGVPGGQVAPPLPERLRGFPPVERMTPEQIQELIQRLQKALEERKARQERREGDKLPRKETDDDKPPLREEADKGKAAKAPEKPDGDDKGKEGLKKPAEGNKGKGTPQGVTDPAAERRELLERIEKLTRELEQLRRKLEQQK
jgi:hypothetical protein